MVLTLIIKGNQENTAGNPIPYERMTQKNKWLPRNRRYFAWKRYVVGCWLERFKEAPKFKRDGYYRLNVACRFKGENHADPENIRKGIQDSLFTGDKHVWGTVTFMHGGIPGVTITVQEGGPNASY